MTNEAHLGKGRVEIPETTALYQTELFSPIETSPMTDALVYVRIVGIDENHE